MAPWPGTRPVQLGAGAPVIDNKNGFLMLQGVLASVVASCIFGGIYYLAPLLAPLNGEQIFGWRVLLTLPFTTLYLVWSGQWPQLLAILRRVRAKPGLAGLLLLSAALVGVQLWLFMWAPLHGHALPVSLGYFLLPLAMVLSGWLTLGERLSRLQTAAAGLAAAGVVWELLRAGGLAWSTWVVVLGYPAYFVLRRRLATNHLAGHWLDMLLLVPVCVWCTLQSPSSWPAVLQTEALHLWLPVLGLVSALALALYMEASRLLSLGLFGLLSYVEPMLLVCAALLMGERMLSGQWPMYAAILAAVVLLCAEGLQQVRRWQLARR